METSTALGLLSTCFFCSKESVDNLQALELNCRDGAYGGQFCADANVGERTRWWAAMVMCAREWSCGKVDTDRYSHIILSPPADIRGHVLVKAMLHAYKVRQLLSLLYL